MWVASAIFSMHNTDIDKIKAEINKKAYAISMHFQKIDVLKISHLM